MVFGLEEQQSIRMLLKNINEAWMKGNPENMNEYFHEEVMFVGQDFQELGKGREACIRSYKDFTSNATVHEFKVSDPHINIWENTAVAAYQFEIVYEMSGENYREEGWDTFVFSRKENRWMAVWRRMSSSPKGD